MGTQKSHTNLKESKISKDHQVSKQTTQQCHHSIIDFLKAQPILKN